MSPGFSEPCSAQCILTIAHYIGLGQGPGHAGLFFSVRLRGEGKLGLYFKNNFAKFDFVDVLKICIFLKPGTSAPWCGECECPGRVGLVKTVRMWRNVQPAARSQNHWTTPKQTCYIRTQLGVNFRARLWTLSAIWVKPWYFSLHHQPCSVRIRKWSLVLLTIRK